MTLKTIYIARVSLQISYCHLMLTNVFDFLSTGTDLTGYPHRILSLWQVSMVIRR